MKGIKRAVFVLLLALCLCFTACGGAPENRKPADGDTPPVNDDTQVKENLLYGIAEPFAGTNVSGFNAEQEAYLAGALGAKTFRLWMYDSNLFGSKYTQVIPDEELATLSESTKMLFNTYTEALREAGIREITCMGMLFPRVASTAVNRDGSFVPRRSTASGSEYMRFLRKVEIVWQAVSAAFTDVDVWEMANETNQAAFLRYVDGNPTVEELAALNADYMFYARKGIKAGNPKAVAVTPGYAPVGGIETVRDFLTDVYEKIESGFFPAGEHKSNNPDDYFDGVAWHPYDVFTGMDLGKEPDIAQWVKKNDQVYAVMAAHGDADKKVWFTEFGHSLSADNLTTLANGIPTSETEYTVNGVRCAPNDAFDEKQAAWIRLYYDALKEMRYVHTCHYFRLCCAKKDAEWGGLGEVFFGCFLEPDASLGRGFYPRKKAYALQRIFGGTGDLKKYA